MRTGLSIIRLLALGLWLGTMVGFAFIFAPAAFAHIGPTPAFAATIAACIRSITGFGTVCGSLALLISVLASRDAVRLNAVSAIGVIAAMSAQLYDALIVLPQMEKTPLLTPAYEALHRSSSSVYSIALLGVTVAFIACALSGRTGRRIE